MLNKFASILPHASPRLPTPAGSGGGEGQQQSLMLTPFATADMVEQAIGLNMQRAGVAKPPLPVVLGCGVSRAAFEALCEATERDFADRLVDLRAALALAESELARLVAERDHLRTGRDDMDIATRKANPTLWQAYRQAHARRAEEVKEMAAAAEELREYLMFVTRALACCKALEIRDEVELGRLDGARGDALYILGHGAPGDAALGPGDDGVADMPSEQLARWLATTPLHKDFDRIKVLACHSADGQAVHALNPAAFAGASPAGGPRPLAQHVSNALAAHGFARPRVYGYHGACRAFVGYLDLKGKLHKQRQASGPQGDVFLDGVKARQAFLPEPAAAKAGRK